MTDTVSPSRLCSSAPACTWLRIIIRNVACAMAAGMAASCAHFVSAPGPVVTDRPGYSDAPTVLPRGALQLESGYTYDRTASETYQSLGEVLVRVGALRGVELRGFVNSYAFRHNPDQTTQGVEDAKVGAKLTLLDADTAHAAVPALAALVATTLPTGDARFSAGKAIPEAKVAASWNAPHGVSMLVNAGLIDIGQTVGPVRFAGSTAVWYSVVPQISTFIELLDATNLHGDRNAIRNADAGATYVIGDRIQLDVRAGRSVGTERVETFVGVGFSRRW